MSEFRPQGPDEAAPADYVAAADPVQGRASKSQRRIAWEQFKRHNAALIGGGILVVMYLVSAFAGFLAPYGINEYRTRPSGAFRPPTQIHWTDPETGSLTRPYVYDVESSRDPVTFQRVYEEDTSERFPIKLLVRRPEATYSVLGLFESDLHLFGVDDPARIFLWGTNSLGKDVFSRVLYGGQISLTIGVLAVWVSLFLGLLLGGLAGYYGGWVDEFVMRLIEVLSAIPGLFLLIVLASLLQDPRNPLARAFGLEMNSAQTFLMVVMVLGFVGWGGLGRTVRSLVLSIREMEYAQAAKALGAGEGRILWRHLLPATASYVIVDLTLAIPGFILTETGLSFLGLGPSAVDTASWGLLLRDATDRGISIQFVPWLLIPGVPIFLAVLCWNLVGDGLRDALDPRKRR
ncbi:MAG: ABC transporter permease [Trueperaceae bacterium]|nr:ABC transporter permease [Trueperaceae bacterium]